MTYHSTVNGKLICSVGTFKLARAWGRRALVKAKSGSVLVVSEESGVAGFAVYRAVNRHGKAVRL